LALQWCYSVVTVVVQCCYSGVTGHAFLPAIKMAQICSRSVTVVLQLMLQWCYSGVTVVLQWCYSAVAVVLQWVMGYIDGTSLQPGVTVVLDRCNLTVATL
jgi:hypothetical protein